MGRLRFWRRTVLAALAALALLAAHDGWRWWQAATLNAQIAAGGSSEPNAAPPLRFAAAYALAASSASGAGETALNRYGALQGDGRLGAAARYNAANLLLRQAMQLHAGAQPGQALALAELAKEHYRELLRAHPDDWNARYNLERAQRLVPEPEEEDEAPPELKRDAERAATTMRCHSPGLP